MKRSTVFLESLAVVAVIVTIYSLLPLASTLQFGGDEGYNLITALLMTKGYVLYDQIWQDQPPLPVLILKWAFKLFGPSVFIARLIAAGFGLLLFTTFFQLVRQRTDRITAYIAVFFLLAAPIVLELSISVMPEVPAFAVGLSSVFLLFQWRDKLERGWLIASGMVMGIAFGIKLTPALLVPALVVEIILGIQQAKPKSWIKSGMIALLLWIACAGLVFAAITFIWGRGSGQMSWKSHFAEQSVPGFPRPEDLALTSTVFLSHWEGFVTTICGLILIAVRRRWRDFAFPIVLLTTMLLVHEFHHPWWLYYYLHFAIPIAWLGSFPVSEGIALLVRPAERKERKGLKPRVQKLLWLSLLAAVPLVWTAKRLKVEVTSLQNRQKTDSDPIIAKMREHAPATRWVYVQFDNEIYAFQSHLLMPPELAMVSMKRFWSGQISTEEIIATCCRYQPGQILLHQNTVTAEWMSFLTDYELVYQDKTFNLYTRKIRQ